MQITKHTTPEEIAHNLSSQNMPYTSLEEMAHNLSSQNMPYTSLEEMAHILLSQNMPYTSLEEMETITATEYLKNAILFNVETENQFNPLTGQHIPSANSTQSTPTKQPIEVDIQNKEDKNEVENRK